MIHNLVRYYIATFTNDTSYNDMEYGASMDDVINVCKQAYDNGTKLIDNFALLQDGFDIEPSEYVALLGI